MDSIFLKLIIIVLLLTIPAYFLYQRKIRDSPRYRQLKTYSSISYAREEQDESSFKSASLFLLTLGSHKEALKSRDSYDNTYEQYSFIFNKVTELQEKVNFGIARLEQNISSIIKALKNSSRLVDDTANIKTLMEEIKSTDKIDRAVDIIDNLGFTKIDRLRAWLPSISIFTAIMAGLLILLIIWFLLLALGGGATLVTYLMVILMLTIPIVTFSTLQSSANIKNFEEQDKLIIEQIKSILDNSEKLENIIILLNTSNSELETYLNEITTINKEVTATLYKNSAYIKAARKSKALFKKETYNKEEIELSHKVNVVVEGLRREIAVSQLLG